MIGATSLRALGLALLASTYAAAEAVGPNRLVPPPLIDDRVGIQKRATGEGVFQQLVDHSNPSLGTFPQRYWWSTEFYAGAGSPVVFFTPGEVEAAGYTGYLTNRTIAGLFSQAIGGANILLEHRYWGNSTPVPNYSTKNLQYLTLENAISDNTYFARNVQLPFALDGSSHPSKAPWIFTGGSYSGALSAWTESVDPGTFWAYHASSAVVETIDDFWQYFEPVREGLPKNCSTDVRRVIDHVDRIIRTGDDAEKRELKEQFGLADLAHDDDFANVLENGPWTWQGHDFNTGYSGTFQWCDYVENMWPGSNNTAPGKCGVGLKKATAGYAKWIKEIIIPGACEGYGFWTGKTNLGCFDSYNATSPMYTDTSLDNPFGRQWMWLLCNSPLKFWQDGAPDPYSTIVSRSINSKYWERQCGLYFPTEDGYSYGIAEGKTTDQVNAWTGGWNHKSTRVMFANGEFDPWKDSTVSSTFRPGGPLESTAETPVFLIPGGIHCSDLLARNGVANAGLQKIIDAEVAQMKQWVGEFKPS